MTAKANWFVEQHVPLDDEPDPFAMPVEEVGERIDLRDPASVLELRVSELLRREGNLHEREITCALKDRRDMSCHACPISKAHDREAPMGMLCRLGREQENVLAELVVLRCRDQ